ncbi:MAG: hypothetical protein ABIH42_10720, partial [Planctomycetota bacterium]
KNIKNKLEKTAEELVSINLSLGDAHKTLGDVLREKGNFKESIEKYNFALTVGIKDISAPLAGIAAAYLALDNTQNAIDNANAAIRINPYNELAQRILQDLGEWTD